MRGNFIGSISACTGLTYCIHPCISRIHVEDASQNNPSLGYSDVKKGKFTPLCKTHPHAILTLNLGAKRCVFYTGGYGKRILMYKTHPKSKPIFWGIQMLLKQ